MKFVYSIVVLAICAISASLAFEATAICEPETTPEQCVQKYDEQYKDSCISLIGGQGYVTIQGCGSVSCGGPNLRKTPVDLSKPYPECCSKCEIIDPNLHE